MTILRSLGLGFWNVSCRLKERRLAHSGASRSMCVGFRTSPEILKQADAINTSICKVAEQVTFNLLRLT